jgi:hypothetical protein
VPTSSWQRVQKWLAQRPVARLGTVGPRLLRWAADTIRGESADPGFPSTRLTPALVGQVALDETIMALAVGPNRFPRRADYVRVGRELSEARVIFDREGWLDDPASFHRTPPPPTEITVTHGWALGRSYERIWWPSGFQIRPDLPGAQRWLDFESNRTASAWVLRHDDTPRPWVVLVHGFGTGSVFMDLFSFRAGHLHDDLGFNVAAIVLPVHGSRKPTRISGEPFLSFDLMNSVHGLTQGVWDIRSLLHWVRAQDPTTISMFGVSLGANLAALVAAFEDDLDQVVAGIPVTDLVELIRHHAPHHIQLRAIEHNILGGAAEDVHRVVTPLALPVAPSTDSLAIFAGMGDRLAPPDQARRLWERWNRPEMRWFPGNHVGYLWSSKVWEFVDASLS